MKVGDYIRTEYGISKIIGIFPEKTMVFVETDNGLGNCKFSRNGKLREGIAILEEDYRYFIDNNVKQKPIDLIEIGDYVNDLKITSINEPSMANCNKRLLYAEDEEGYLIERFDEEDIKSIVTKEQFESMKYEVK